mgnify:FL=1
MPDRKEDHSKTASKLWHYTKKIINSLIIVILVLVICLMAFVLIQNRVQKTATPSLGPYRLYIVLSGSMEPVLQVGGLVVVKEVPVSEIQEGDIITFYSSGKSGTTTTHRVIGIEEGLLFQTKGDANEVADPAPVEASRIIGKVTLHIPYAGYVLDFVKRNPQLPAFIALPAFLLILWEVLKFGQRLKREHVNNGNN